MKLFKITSVLLSIAMCMSFVMTPVCVFADETEAPAETSESTESKETEESKETVKATEPSKETKPAESAPETTGENAPDESVPETSKIELPVQNKENEEPSEAAPSESQPEEASEGETVPSETVPPQTDRKVRKNSVVASGTCGDYATSTLDSEGNLVITGSGPMYDSVSSCPWVNHRSSIKSVVIDEGVATICTGAFYGSKIKSITIPSSITCIDYYAFQECSELESVAFASDSSLRTIEGMAFSDCSSLKNIQIPSSVKTLGSDAFARCESIVSISLPVGITKIDAGTFSYCTSLKDITIPDGVTSIGDTAFDHCEKLESVTLPDSVTLIDYMAFNACKSLKKVVIPVSVTRIESGAFKSCTNLSRVVIDKALHQKTTGDQFSSCPNAQFSYHFYDIEYAASDYGTVKGKTSANSTDTVELTITPVNGYQVEKVTYKFGNKTVDVLSNDVKYSFTMPVGKVTVEVTYKKSDIPSGTCGDNLTWTIDAQGTLTISGTGEMDTWSDESKRPWKPYLDSIKTVKVMEGVTSIGQCAFISCKNITSVSLPSTLTAISHDAFQGCANLPAVSLPDGLKSIGVWAFADCDSLTAITIPNSVTSIGGGAFMDCDNLKDVIIDEEFYKSIGYDPFDRSNNVALHFVSSYDEITYIKTNNATNGTGTVKVAGASSKVVNVIIPAVVVLDGISYKVTAIDSNAFKGNLKITTVSIGSNVTSIGNNAFYGCIGLTKVSGGAKVKTIGSNAFAYCSKLSSFTISSKVLSKIGAQAFNKDKKLKTLNIKKTTKLTKKGVKKSLKGSSIKTVKVKKSKVKKYKKIFKKKNSGRKVMVKK